MKSAFIIHDSFSNPDQNWYPWLRRELETLGYTVFIPTFPTPEHQSLEQWTTIFEPYRTNVSEETIFIGHGTGCAFILRLLEKDFSTIRAGFFVAPFVGEIPHEALQLASATFTSTPFLWKVIHERSPILISIASNDDPYVPLVYSTQASELLGTPLITVPESGHFSDPAGNISLAILLEKIIDLDTIQPSEDEVANQLLNNELTKAGITLPTTYTPETTTDDELFLEKKELEPINTYYRDITHMLNTAETKDMAGILRAEREQEKNIAETKKRIIINVCYALCTCLLIVASILVIQRLKTPEPTTVELSTETVSLANSLVRVDAHSSLSLETNSLFTLRKRIRDTLETTSVAPGYMHQLYPTRLVGGVEHPVPLANLFTTLELSVPPTLLESIGNEYVYGLYGGRVPEPFILVTLSSFDRAFTGMRAWESSLAQDVQDLFGFDTELVRPSLYTRTFTDETITNYPVRILRAPRYTRETHTEYSEHILPAPPTRHILTTDTLSHIETITDTGIVFLDPTDFLKNLSVGDIIISTGTTSDHPAFLRKILGFTLDGEKLVIATRTATPTEAVVQTTHGNTVRTRVRDDGSLEYYALTETQVDTDREGSPEVVLLYTFLSDTQLLITTNEDVIGAVVARLASKERDVVREPATSIQQ